MPKISGLPAITTPDGADELPIVDDDQNTTKKITLTKLKEWLQSLAGWITTAMIGDAEVTTEKLQSTVAFHATTTQSITSETNITTYTEVTDLGGDFDHTTGEFVAPYDGMYNFSAIYGVQNSANRTHTYIRLNGATVAFSFATGAGAANADPTSCASITIELTAGDVVNMRAYNEASSRAAYESSFSGFMIGQV